MTAAFVDIGFFPAFKDGDTLLINAKDEGIGALQILLAKLAGGQQAYTSLHSLPWVRTHGVSLDLRCTSHDIGVQSGQPSEFQWCCTQTTWLRFAAALSTLAREKSGHQYLDTQGQSIQVLVSCNEYPHLFPNACSAA